MMIFACLRQFNSCVVVDWCTYECSGQARPDITTHHMGWRWSGWRLEFMVALQCAWSHNATALCISNYPKHGNLKLSVVFLFWVGVVVGWTCCGSLLNSGAVNILTGTWKPVTNCKERMPSYHLTQPETNSYNKQPDPGRASIIAPGRGSASAAFAHLHPP